MSRKAPVVTCVFIDIGGVLLTDGWDHQARKRAARNFRMNWAEMEERHHLVFETFEEGKLSLAEYLERVVFYRSACLRALSGGASCSRNRNPIHR